MKKLIPITLIFLMMTFLVGAVEICEENLNPSDTCVLTTPIISCTNYTYDIYNKTGGFIENGTLTLFDNSGSYYLNFSKTTGTYYVKLCDNSTKELYVGVGGVNEVKGGMAWIAIAILMICMTGFMGWGANMIQDKALMHIKKLLFYLFLTNTFMLGIIGFIASTNAFTPSSFQNLGLGYAGVNLILISGFTINYTYLTLYRVFEKGRDNFRKAFNKNEGNK